MLSREELEHVYQHAYLPEHLPHYVEAVSGAEPYLHADCLCFSRKNHLTFIGYPLRVTSGDIRGAYESACERFRPTSVAIIAPSIWLSSESYDKQPGDSYYRLPLPVGTPASEVAYMVRRAGRELRVTRGNFGREHQRVVKNFVSKHAFTQAQLHIFQRMHLYMKRSKSAHLLEARKGDTLVAFAIVDIGSAAYAFYLFSIRSVDEPVPGASDLLFSEMVRVAEIEGKRAINLGLGINPGNRRFKEKWGGTPFLDYTTALINRKPFEIGSLMHKL